MWIPLHDQSSHTLRVRVSYVLLVALLAWMTGIPGFVSPVHALQVQLFSDTLSTSKPGIGSDHTLVFTVPSGVPADGSQITITIPAGFDMSAIVHTDVAIDNDGTPLSVDALCGAVNVAVSTSTQTISIEICNGGGGAIALSAEVTVRVGEHAGGTNRIVNHATPGDYEIVLATSGSVSDEGRTRIVIIESVTVSGVVMTYFAFSVGGVDEGMVVNEDTGDTVTATSTATTLPFGVVSPGNRYVLAQDLFVTTNSRAGFTVTVEARDELRASNNAIIDAFADGGADATPGPWSPPSATAGATTTYGHWGLTTEDATLSDGDSFGDALYVGNFIGTPREIMHATSSADGTTAHIGATRAGYKLQISPMQEAADSYTTTLVYVATPVF